MQKAIESRLAELRQEQRRGEEMLVELQQRHAALRDTLLRICGAVQVLEELAQAEGDAEDSPAPAACAA
ncbi:MAG TPA: hypothetical protein VGX50_19715 [Longimicrobium sp.]|jgi:chaperonin cofactor prefoldin|nr:hypothetical protein [Longimicrobium sp.]